MADLTQKESGMVRTGEVVSADGTPIAFQTSGAGPAVAASAGGPLAILAAARPDAGVAATVALSPAGISADAQAPDMPRIAAAARTARVPVLYVLARDDSSASLKALKALHDSGVDRGARLRILPRGAGHAQETLYTPTMEPSRFRTELLDFIAAHTR